jgi:hypothetical protein
LIEFEITLLPIPVRPRLPPLRQNHFGRAMPKTSYRAGHVFRLTGAEFAQLMTLGRISLVVAWKGMSFAVNKYGIP